MSRSNPVWRYDSDDSEEDDQQKLLKESNQGYQSIETQAIRDHEAGLDKLGEAIKRQKYIANEIATEVEVHNEILDEMDTGLSRTSDNLRKNVRNINLVTRKSSTCFLWTVIFILAAVIATLGVI